MSGHSLAVSEIHLASDASQITDTLSLDGVAGFVEGRAREAMRAAMTKEGSDWLCDAFARAVNSSGRGDGPIDLSVLFRQDAGLKSAVQADLKERLKAWLPGKARELIGRDLLGAVLGSEGAEEAMKIAERVAAELDTSLNDKLDAIASDLYDSTLDRVRKELAEKGISQFIDIEDLRGSVRRAFELENVSSLAASNLARVLGEGTVLGIRGRIEDALSGNLPPEAMEALRRGPEAFDRYVEEARARMPGNVLLDFKDSILNRPIIKLPTAAYASMLAAVAAEHYARAYRGAFVDAHELKRAVEVTRVMVWQIENKEAISLTLMQLGAMAGDLAGALGMGVSFDKALAKVTAPLDRVQEKADRIDSMLARPMELAQAELRGLAMQMEAELKKIQEALTAPVRGALANLETEMKRLGEAAADALPFDGVPTSFDELKERLGLPEELLGERGRWRPADAMGETLDKVKGDMAALNERASDLIAQAAADALETTHLLGPAAAIMEIERVPAQEPSDKGPLDPVLLHNGEYVQEVTDLVIPGRGLDFRFARIYRGRSDFKGELGWRWTHSFAERLLPWEDEGRSGLTHVDERGRKFFYAREKDGFSSSSGVLSKLSEVDDGKFLITSVDGVVTEFDSRGRPLSKCERHGNCMVYEYGGDGILAAIVDVFGRRVVFERRDDGFISSIEDFAGRKIRFEYNGHGELIGVRSPAVAEFPKGKLTAYRYETPPEGDPRSHRISMIMDPAGRVFLRNRYDGEGRVIAQRYGDGAWMRVQYAAGTGAIASRAWIVDESGVTTLYEHDSEGHLVRRWRWLGNAYRILEYAGFSDGALAYSCSPSGRCEQYAYDERGLPMMIAERPAGEGPVRATEMKREERFGRIEWVKYPDGLEERTEYSQQSPYDPEARYERCDPDSDWVRKAAFLFDGRGQLLEEKDANNVVTTYEYYSAQDPDGDGVAIVSKDGPVFVEDDGDGGGYLKRVVTDAREGADRRAFGAVAQSSQSFRYDPIGNVIEQTGPDGSSVKFVVNSINGVMKEEAEGLWPIAYSFDANDNVSAIEIQRPGSTVAHRFEHDSLDRLVKRDMQESSEARLVTKYAYDAGGRLASSTMPEGNRTEYLYDDDGRMRCIVRGAGSEVSSRECVERDLDGEAIVYIDGGGGIARLERNGFGEIVSETDALGNRIDYARDRAGRIVAIKRMDADGVLLSEERFEYAGEMIAQRSQRLWREDPKNSRWVSTSRKYDVQGRLISEADALGSRTSYEYDGLGELARMVAPDGSAEVFVRDRSGRVIESFVEKEGKRYGLVERRYRGAGMLASHTEGTESPWRYRYDGMGLLRSAMDPSGIESIFEYDDMGRRIAIARQGDGLKSMAKFGWDGNGRLAAIVDPNGNRTSFEYDAQDRLSIERFADGSEQRSAYDGAGRVSKMINRDGGVMEIERDPAGRMTRRTATQGAPSPFPLPRGESLPAGQAGVRERATIQTFEYDGMGRLLRAFDENDPSDSWDDSEVRIAYDSMSRPIAEGSGDSWIVRSFDDAGRRIALSLPGGGSLYYAYDAAGGLASMMGPKGSVAQISRDPLGNLIAAKMADGVSLSVDRDAWGREISRRYARGDDLLASWKRERDGAGKVVSTNDSLLDATIRYGRDGLGRLTEAASVGAISYGYEYDPAGNVLAMDDGSGVRRMRYNALNQVVSSSSQGGELLFEYDGAGRLISDGEQRYGYDPFGRLSSIITPSELYHRRRYDAFARLVIEGGEGDTYARFIWDGWRLASFYDDEEERFDFAHAEGLAAPLAYLRGDHTSSIVTDGNASARAAVEEGALSQRCDFHPYGEAIDVEVCMGRRHPFGFAGQLHDVADGLVYMRYRHYVPRIAAFATPDPLGYKFPQYADATFEMAPGLSYHAGQGQASRAAIPNRPLGSMESFGAYPFGRWFADGAFDAGVGEINLYAYAQGDPISNWDPWGLASLFFDRDRETMMLFDGEGYLVTEYQAANRTTRPKVDPAVVGGRGPVPDGEFTIGVPEFYSVQYRNDFYRRFGLGHPLPGESRVSGPGWAGVMDGSYNVSQGRIRFRVGAPTGGVDRIAWNRGLFVHGGRYNRHTSRTHGCIRARDDELETLAANFIAFQRQGDAVDMLYVE